MSKPIETNYGKAKFRNFSGLKKHVQKKQKHDINEESPSNEKTGRNNSQKSMDFLQNSSKKTKITQVEIKENDTNDTKENICFESHLNNRGKFYNTKKLLLFKKIVWI